MATRQWQSNALALAAAAFLSLPSPPAQALALGRITVQSALGEPLRADIDIPEVTPEELASLRAAIASPETFRSSGLEYNAVLGNVQVTLQRRPDGRPFLRLTSDRPVNDPFIDLILDTSWSSGRIMRDFTVLLDPPSLRQPQTPLAAQVGPSTTPAPAGTAVPAPVAPQRAQRSAAASPVAPAPSAPASATATPPSAPTAPTGDPRQVTVQAGDTAGKIASAGKPNTVSLDQMLVALLRANPDAFGGGNVNRLRAGTVLNLPTAEQAEAVDAAEARQTLVAQSRDFNEFRRRLAEGVPSAPATGNGRETSGKVQAQVDEKKPAASAPDKLTLSKGAVQGQAAADQVARQRAAEEAATRVAELNRNLSELNRLSSATPTATAPKAAVPSPSTATSPNSAAPAPASTPAISVPSVPNAASSASAPAVAAAGTAPGTAPAASAPAGTAAVTAQPTAPAASAPAAVASQPAEPASASAPATQTSADAATTPASAASTPVPASTPAVGAPAAQAKAPAPIAEPSLAEELLENPVLPAAAAGVLALLLGLLIFRGRQRRKNTQVDSSFLESRLQPDSFFGASGGQRVDTAEGTPTGSSMVYSPSQLDAAGDVDPVAEADVYLAYGRDLQAEEILKEALRITPQRVAIHTKLLEIYAKRRDTKAFEQVASEAYSHSQGEGSEWARICELGQELDPSNPMYKPGGQPSGGAPLTAAGAGLGASGRAAQPAREPVPVAIDLDLDLDFSLGDDEAGAPPAQAGKGSANQATASFTAPAAAAAPMDFGMKTSPMAMATQPIDLDLPKISGSSPEAIRLDAPDLTLSGNSLDFSAEPLPKSAKAARAVAPAAPARDEGMIELDLGALSLDLDAPAASAPAQVPTAASKHDEPISTAALEPGSEDPLATKLALAQEFNAIGDADGARSLAQEVIAEASGDLKNRAQRFLAEIG